MSQVKGIRRTGSGQVRSEYCCNIYAKKNREGIISVEAAL